MKRISILGFLLFLTAIPFFAGEYYINLMSQIMIAAIFAASLNLLIGYAGLTSLGHAVYLGLAAYISAWLSTKLGLGHATTAPIVLISTTIMGMIFGWIALRATGLGFLMLTLALSQIFWGLAYRWVSVTNGDNGISGLTRPSPFGVDLESSSNFYWFILIITTLALLAIARFRIFSVRAIKFSFLATKSVSQFNDNTAPKLLSSDTLERTTPSEDSRSARLLATSLPFSRMISIARSKLPSASVRAFLQSIIPAPVALRNFATFQNLNQKPM